MNAILEGNEIEQKIGDVGLVTVDVNPELKLKVSAIVEIDLLAELKKLADKTATPYDDMAIAWIEKVLKAGSVLGA
jgi:hypothetical protein